MITTELNLLDAALLSIERPQDPWSIHLELQLEKRIDEERPRAAHMPMGVSVGAVSLADRMTLTLRYRRAVFDTAAAKDFAERYRAILLDGRR